MSLRSFHLFFISIASILAFFFGAWGLRYSQTLEHSAYFTAGLFSLAIGFGLIVYGVLFWQKTRDIS